MESVIFIYAYFLGIALLFLSVPYIAYKAGELKRKNISKILTFPLLSWVGIAILICTAIEWNEQKRQRERRFPRPEVKDNIF